MEEIDPRTKRKYKESVFITPKIRGQWPTWKEFTVYSDAPSLFGKKEPGPLYLGAISGKRYKIGRLEEELASKLRRAGVKDDHTIFHIDLFFPLRGLGKKEEAKHLKTGVGTEVLQQVLTKLREEKTVDWTSVVTPEPAVQTLLEEHGFKMIEDFHGIHRHYLLKLR